MYAAGYVTLCLSSQSLQHCPHLCKQQQQQQHLSLLRAVYMRDRNTGRLSLLLSLS